MAVDFYDLKFLESTTNLRAVAKRALGRKPNAAVARDITVSIQQGRLFFEQAQQSPIQIRPLLVYYGVLSFARALTAAVKNVELAKLEQGHGLKDVGTPNSIEKLRLSVQKKGTFAEFNDAIAPKARFFYFDNFMGKSVPNPFKTAEDLIGKQISIVDILSRIPSLTDTFQKTFARQPECLALTLHKEYNRLTNLRIDNPNIIKDRDQLIELVSKLRSEYPFLKKWRLETVDLAWDNTVLVFGNAEFDGDDLSKINISQLDNGTFVRGLPGYTAIVEPITILPPLAGGFDKEAHHWAIRPISDVILNEYSLQFLGAYLLGSLVRYRPQIWQHAISKSVTQDSPADDRSLSLVEHFIDDVLGSFPKLVTNLFISGV